MSGGRFENDDLLAGCDLLQTLGKGDERQQRFIYLEQVSVSPNQF